MGRRGIHGTWSDAWQGVLELDPEFLKSYLDLSMVPWRKNHLDPKVKDYRGVPVPRWSVRVGP